MTTQENAAAGSSTSSTTASAGATRRVENEEPNFFGRKHKVPKNRQGLITGLRSTNALFLFGMSCMLFGGVLGPMYVKKYYSPGFLQRLEESVKSKRMSFWEKRNMAQAYVTRKVTSWYDWLGFKSFNLRP